MEEELKSSPFELAEKFRELAERTDSLIHCYLEGKPYNSSKEPVSWEELLAHIATLRKIMVETSNAMTQEQVRLYQLCREAHKQREARNLSELGF